MNSSRSGSGNDPNNIKMIRFFENLKKIEGTVETSQNEVKILKDEITRLTSHVGSLNDEITRLNTRYEGDVEKFKNQELNAFINKLTDMNSSLKAENKSFKAELDHMNVKFGLSTSGFEAKIVQLNRTIYELDFEYANCMGSSKDEAHYLRHANQELNSHNDELRNENISFKAEIDALKMKLDTQGGRRKPRNRRQQNKAPQNQHIHPPASRGDCQVQNSDSSASGGGRKYQYVPPFARGGVFQVQNSNLSATGGGDESESW